MPCDVYVYDDQMKPLTSGGIELVELERWGKQVDHQWNGPMGGGKHGATLAPPKPPVPVSIWVNDKQGNFGPASLKHIDSSLTKRLDVALFPLPIGASGGGGGGGGGGRGYGGLPPGPQTVVEVDEYIEERRRAGDWTSEEATGVRAVVTTMIDAMMTPRPPGSVLSEWIEEWRSQLAALGINVRTGDSSRGSGSSSSGSSPLWIGPPLRHPSGESNLEAGA